MRQTWNHYKHASGQFKLTVVESAGHELCREKSQKYMKLEAYEAEVSTILGIVKPFSKPEKPHVDSPLFHWREPFRPVLLAVTLNPENHMKVRSCLQQGVPPFGVRVRW